jgi:hypothetical protein
VKTSAEKECRTEGREEIKSKKLKEVVVLFNSVE